MRKLILYVTFLSGSLVVAQTQSLPLQQSTTSAVGITRGQTARLTVTVPYIITHLPPEPIQYLPVNVDLVIRGQNGAVLASKNVPQLSVSSIASVELNADTAGLSAGTTLIYGGSSSVCALPAVDDA
jgi:hypothetical protein